LIVSKLKQYNQKYTTKHRGVGSNGRKALLLGFDIFKLVWRWKKPVADFQTT